MYSYVAYGLHVHAGLPLPELLQAPAGAAPDVVIARDTLPVLPKEVIEGNSLCIGIRKEEVHYVWREFGALLIRGGRQIFYDPHPGMPDSSMRAPLLGVGFGTLLHQRGVLTLHASCVSIGGRAVAFLGNKGDGKSTTSALLHSRGHSLVTDDVLAVHLKGASAPEVWPAFPNQKLCRDSIAAIGERAEAYPELHPALDKRVRSARAGFSPEPVPLHAIFVLADGPEIGTSRLTGGAAFSEVVRHSYAARFLGADQVGGGHFQQILSLVQQVPTFRLTRPRDLFSLPALGAFLEDHVHMPCAA